jgi:hypothetical protein
MNFPENSRGLFLGHGLGQHAHDIALLHDQEFGAVDLDLGARAFAKQHPVADLEVDRGGSGFSFAVSGMMMPQADLSSASMRLTITRSVEWTELHWCLP